jgi:hypothetical protein
MDKSGKEEKEGDRDLESSLLQNEAINDILLRALFKCENATVERAMHICR